MKAVLLAIALFFSISAHSASFIELTPNSSNNLAAPGGVYIGTDYICGEASCSLNLFDPSIFLPIEIYEIYYGDLDSIDNGLFFIDNGNVHLREMWISQAFKVVKNSPIHFEWNASDAYSFNLNIDGNQFNSTSGSFLQDFYIGQEFSIYMAGEAFSADANLELKITDLSQVPIPPAIYLFAPALLGFIGLRKKQNHHKLA